eukprot:12183277-Ditylum_brightwellii.AAC.2
MQAELECESTRKKWYAFLRKMLDKKRILSNFAKICFAPALPIVGIAANFVATVDIAAIVVIKQEERMIVV